LEQPLLQVIGVRKAFGGLLAVNDVDFWVPEGQIASLIGPNGAGKTTVFNLITGIETPDAGKILFAGRDITGCPPHVITRAGIARTFQTLRLFPNLTCLENVMAGQHVRTKAGLLSSILHTRRQREEERQICDAARRCLDKVGLWHLRAELAKNLSYGDQRLLEIARALATEPSLLILDEPASGLNNVETARLMGLIREIRDEGITILLIEHDMDVVMGISEWITVLDNGRKIGQGTPEDIQQNEEVIVAYLGKEEEDFSWNSCN
jgi:ABC-type branched-subunit amino acid transport system ATPase component